jgi:hypothetical protein
MALRSWKGASWRCGDVVAGRVVRAAGRGGRPWQALEGFN